MTYPGTGRGGPHKDVGHGLDASNENPEIAGMEIPEGSGTHREALIAILSRIPPHWGRWIDCGAGWFPIIAALHGELIDLDPNYVVRQVKQKFGALRYYAGSSIDDPVIQERFSALLDIAERLSTTVCEVCGRPARLSVSDGDDPQYMTICALCAAEVVAGDGTVYRPYIAPPR